MGGNRINEERPQRLLLYSLTWSYRISKARAGRRGEQQVWSREDQCCWDVLHRSISGCKGFPCLIQCQYSRSLQLPFPHDQWNTMTFFYLASYISPEPRVFYNVFHLSCMADSTKGGSQDDLWLQWATSIYSDPVYLLMWDSPLRIWETDSSSAYICID